MTMFLEVRHVNVSQMHYTRVLSPLELVDSKLLLLKYICLTVSNVTTAWNHLISRNIALYCIYDTTHVNSSLV